MMNIIKMNGRTEYSFGHTTRIQPGSLSEIEDTLTVVVIEAIVFLAEMEVDLLTATRIPGFLCSRRP